jgi:hypothetical protein
LQRSVANTPAAARIPADQGCIIESDSGALDVGVDVELGIRVEFVVDDDDSAEIYWSGRKG